MEQGKNQDYPYCVKTVGMSQVAYSFGALEIVLPQDYLEIKAISCHIRFHKVPYVPAPEQFPGGNTLLRLWVSDSFFASNLVMDFAVSAEYLLYGATFKKFINVMKNAVNGYIDIDIDLTPFVNKNGRNIIWPEFDNAVYGVFDIFKIDILYTVKGNQLV